MHEATGRYASFRTCSVQRWPDPVTIRSATGILELSLSAASRVVTVLVWSDNRILSTLVSQNLVSRGFDVQALPLPTTGAPSAVLAGAADATLAIVDLDCQEPDLWRRAAHLRAMLPGMPLVILGHAWPTAPRLDALQPCRYVRKPFAIDALLAAVQAASMHVTSTS